MLAPFIVCQGVPLAISQAQDLLQSSDSYGPPLTLDLNGCGSSTLADSDACYEVLLDLPLTVGMRALAPPVILRYDGGGVAEDWGVTGTVVIAESHVSLHTYPEKQFAFFDLFSCRSFDLRTVFELVACRFEPIRIDAGLMLRGQRFVRSPR